ncbi:MAG: AMP nucleosidase, partial [Gemmobacter sp.]
MNRPDPAILTPDAPAPELFVDAAAAVARLEALYVQATDYLVRAFTRAVTEGRPPARIRAYYPEIRLTVARFGRVDSRLSFGHVSEPGVYATTITRPDLFRNYLRQQIELLLRSHGEPVQIGPSDTPIPVH